MVISTDEKTSIQALEHKNEKKPMQIKRRSFNQRMTGANFALLFYLCVLFLFMNKKSKKHPIKLQKKNLSISLASFTLIASIKHPPAPAALLTVGVVLSAGGSES